MSKPLIAPWNDSSKNLARDVALHLKRYEAWCFDDGRHDFTLPQGRIEAVYNHTSRLPTQLQVLRRLAFGRQADLWHFFFAPNLKSSLAGWGMSRLRRRPSVQTICSRPRDMTHGARLLFADRNVVLSRQTERAFLEAGVARNRLHYIPPAIQPLAPISREARTRARIMFNLPIDQPVVLFPGDLEFGEGAERLIRLWPQIGNQAILVMACRPKTKRAHEIEQTLRRRAEATKVGSQIHWIGETPHIHALIGASDAVALPSRDLYAKMDLPLVLLEAMSLAKPIVVSGQSAAHELADGGGALVEHNDHELVSALQRISQDLEGNTAIGGRGRERSLSEYHPMSMSAAYEALYDDLIQGDERPAIA